MWRYIVEKRVCKYCSKEYDLDKFPIANTLKGKVYRRWRCQKCYRVSKNERKFGIRDWLKDLKKTFKCKECGENKFYMLDLHHRDPGEKEQAIGEIVGRGWGRDKILKEISKCDVLCSNHHRELHYNLRNGM